MMLGVIKRILCSPYAVLGGRSGAEAWAAAALSRSQLAGGPAALEGSSQPQHVSPSLLAGLNLAADPCCSGASTCSSFLGSTDMRNGFDLLSASARNLAAVGRAWTDRSSADGTQRGVCSVSAGAAHQAEANTLQGTADLPRLESLVDPESITGFLCGNAADGSIGMRSRTNRSNALAVRFVHSNHAKLLILQSHYQQAAGEIKSYDRPHRAAAWVLAYHGKQCKQLLQVLQQCPIKHTAAELALEFLDESTDATRRKHIQHALLEFNERKTRQLPLNQKFVSMRNSGVSQVLITPAFIAGLFAAHGCVCAPYNKDMHVSRLCSDIFASKAPRVLYFIQQFLGSGMLYPASARIHGEDGAYTRLHFAQATDVVNFCKLVSGQEALVATGVLPGTASGLPRAIGIHKLQTYVCIFQEHGYVPRGNARQLHVNGRVDPQQWLAMCPEFWGSECPSWER